MRLGFPELLIVTAILVMLAVLVWPAARICRRAGFTPWLGLLILIPLANLILLWYVALARWPALPSSGRDI